MQTRARESGGGVLALSAGAVMEMAGVTGSSGRRSTGVRGLTGEAGSGDQRGT